VSLIDAPFSHGERKGTSPLRFDDQDRQDQLVPPADGKAYQEAGSEPKTLMWYDAGHGLDKQAVEDRQRWLAEKLGLAG
jgi:hypothetical protein